MFSNVNEVVQQLYLAEAQGYQFHIDWQHSCYFEQQYGDNPWLYYFKPCFELADDAEIAPKLTGGRAVACLKDNIITPRLKDGECSPLLIPKDRDTPGALIEKYIHLQPGVKSIVDQQVARFAGRFTIGLHIRGLGRVHGGAAAMLRHAGKAKPEIDYDIYFHTVNRLLKAHPDAAIFLCSDAQSVIDHTVSVYGDRVMVYDASRSDYGEMHINHSANAGLEFSPWKLGLDVVVEAYTLAATDYFIHGNSNVANYVICRNSKFDHHYIYEQQEKSWFADNDQSAIQPTMQPEEPAEMSNHIPTLMTEGPALGRMINLLKPMVTDRKLVRMGPEGDGGYLVPDDLDGITACFSPGVANVSGFEAECADRGMGVYMADRSVSAPASEHANFHFINKYVGVTTSDTFIPMDTWVRQSVGPVGDDLLLQMDIEGYEYENLLNMSDELTNRFRVILVECHGMHLFYSKPYFQLASRALIKLAQSHQCVHIHPNNCATAVHRRGYAIPRVMEFTFLRKDRIQSMQPATVFPHPLDRDNTDNPTLVLPDCWQHS